MTTRYMGRALNSPAPARMGTNTAIFHVSASLSVSVGDTYVIGKLPHGAIPTGAVFYPAGEVLAKFGTSASLSLFFGSATYSAGANFNTKRLGPSFQISVSDDLALRQENVTMVPSAGLSLGAIGDLIVTYVMPGQTL